MPSIRVLFRRAVLSGTALAASALLAPVSAHADALPTDPSSGGYVGLCNEAGQNVTGGSINAKPFVWKAVASTQPPRAYQGHGQNAVLNVFQPRPQVPPAEWNGLSVTAATFYSTPTHPAAQATYADVSLRDVMTQYPAKVSGLYQLRMYYGRADYGLYSTRYPATTIQVTGSTWRVVRGGTVDCGHARGTSLEQLNGVVTKAQVTPRKPAAAQRVVHTAPGRRIDSTPAGTSGRSAGTASSSPAGSHAAADGRSVDASAAADTSGNGISWLTWSLCALVLLLGAALTVVVRSRRAAPTVESDDPLVR